MAYSESIKNFNRIRDYMREFYVYGFKSRNEYDKKSQRSYDDERRRMESWLGDYMQFRQTKDGKNVFISIDSRSSNHNPLYKAWKAKSFTDGDITIHFILMDIMAAGGEFTINQISEKIDEYLSYFEEPKTFDESTIRKKLKEYVEQGLVVTEKKGKVIYYKMAKLSDNLDKTALEFFSEIAPCGVIGSFLLDKYDEASDEEKKTAEAHDKLLNDDEAEVLKFKHHYITGAMDSEVLYNLFIAISNKSWVTIKGWNARKNLQREQELIPLKIMISAQSGRQYLMAYSEQTRRISSFRLDNIISVEQGKYCDSFDKLRATLLKMQSHMWGISSQINHKIATEAYNTVTSDSKSKASGDTQSNKNNPGNTSQERLEHVEFTIHYADYESYIERRLEREKRCGNVIKIDKNTSRFSADVYDASELIPWIRTFICRITEIHFSNKNIEKMFKKDIQAMYRLYGIGDDKTQEIKEDK